MAWAYILNSVAGNMESASAGTVAVTCGVNPTAGNLLVVFVGSDSVTTSPTVADTLLNTYTEITTCKRTSPHVYTAFYAKNIAGGGSNNVTVTFNSNDTNRFVVVAEYSGLSTSAPLDTGANNNQSAPGTGANDILCNITVAAANELLVAFCDNWAGSFDLFTPGTSPNTFTERYDAHPNFIRQLTLEDANTSGAGATSATFGNGAGAADSYVTMAAAFKVTGGFTVTAAGGSYTQNGTATVLRPGSTTWLRYRK